MDKKVFYREIPSGESAPEEKNAAKPNAFVRFLKFVFVKDIILKAAAIATSVLMWMLISGLN